jgi:putative transcriptional regulator
MSATPWSGGSGFPGGVCGFSGKAFPVRTRAGFGPIGLGGPCTVRREVCLVRASSEDDWRQFRAALILQERGREGPQLSKQGMALLRKNEALMGVTNPTLRGMELWAVPTTVVEKGSVVVAASALSSAATLLQQHRQEAVIFIFQHDNSGTRGLILNRPTSLTLGRTLIQSSSGETNLRQLFSENVLYMGGGEIGESVFVLHSRPDLWTDSEEVISGIYRAGGVVPEDLGARLESTGRTMSERSEQFKFYCGQESWGPGELDLEVRDGLWTVASVSPALVAKHCLQLPCPLWLEICLRLGGEPAEAASQAYANLLRAETGGDEG